MLTPVVCTRVYQCMHEFKDVAIQRAGVLFSLTSRHLLEMQTVAGPQPCEASPMGWPRMADPGQVYVPPVLSCPVPSGWVHINATAGFLRRGTKPGGIYSVPCMLSAPDAKGLGPVGCEFPALLPKELVISGLTSY